MSNGLLEPSLLSQRNPEVVVRLRIIGTYSQRFLIMVKGRLVFPLAIETNCQVAVCLCMVGVDF